MDKVIHYCWFGGKPLPEDVLKCIDSWKEHLPDFEIRRWDETNFDPSVCVYAQEAYDHQKWAFVSDYARFWILYHFGGIYFDTDVEVIRPMDDILEEGPFMGCEPVTMDDGRVEIQVSAGIGMAAEPGMPLFRKILDRYEEMRFVRPDGTLNYDTVVRNVTEIMRGYGFTGSGEVEKAEGFLIYPPEYFSPLDFFTGELKITENTHAIHHYKETWKNPAWIRISAVKRRYAATGKRGSLMEKIQLLPLRILNRIENEGLKGLLRWKKH